MPKDRKRGTISRTKKESAGQAASRDASRVAQLEAPYSLDRIAELERERDEARDELADRNIGVDLLRTTAEEQTEEIAALREKLAKAKRVAMLHKTYMRTLDPAENDALEEAFIELDAALADLPEKKDGK